MEKNKLLLAAFVASSIALGTSQTAVASDSTAGENVDNKVSKSSVIKDKMALHNKYKLNNDLGSQSKAAKMTNPINNEISLKNQQLPVWDENTGEIKYYTNLDEKPQAISKSRKGVMTGAATDVANWTDLKTNLTAGTDEINVTGDITATDSFGVTGQTSTLELNGNTISGNGGNSEGISLFNGSDLTINNSSEDAGQISGLDRSATGAGIINVQNSSLKLTGNEIKFVNNNSKRGAIQVWESVNPSESVVTSTVNSLVFDHNTSDMGGAIYHEQRYSDSSVVSELKGNSNVFTNNSATAGNGGAILNVVGNLSVIGDTNTFTNNSRTGAVGEAKFYKRGGGAIANASGESIDGTSAAMIIGKSTSTNTFTNNTSDTNGGAIMNRAVDIDKSATLTISGNSTFTGNTASKHGGAIYNMRESLTGAIDEHTANVTVNGASTFSNNTAGGLGGAIYNSGNMVITGATFTGNRTTAVSYQTDEEYPTNELAQGGAIYNSGCDVVWEKDSDAKFSYNGILNISNSNFGIEDNASSGNQSSQGGAIANAKANGLSGEVTLTNVNFYNNKALTPADSGYSALGGALYNNGKVTINGDTTFKVNKAEGYASEGGAIYNTGTLTFNDAVTFASNTVEDTDGANGGMGGAISNNGTMTFKDAATFTSNKAIGDGQTSGGAIYNEGTLTFEKGASFTGNEAMFGGAIFNRDTLTITDGSFTNNAAGDEGGAIFNLMGTVNVNANDNNVTFSGNTASGQANDIIAYRGTVNLNAASGKKITMDGGIASPSSYKGALNINTTPGNTGTVEVGSALNNQTVTVSAGELWLKGVELLGGTRATDITGSTISVASDAIINTIDNNTINYTDAENGIIELATGAIVKGDINYAEGAADLYKAADGCTSIVYKMANAMGADTQYGAAKEIQVVDGNVTVNDTTFAWYSGDKGLTLVSSGEANGKVIVTGVAGGINAAVNNTSGTPSDVEYAITGSAGDTFTGEGGNRTIENSNFEITGKGTEGSDPALTLAANMIVDESSTLSVNNAKFDTETDKGITTEGTVFVNDSAIGVDITATGSADVTASDSTIAGAVTNSGTGTFQATDSNISGNVANTAGGTFSANNTTISGAVNNSGEGSTTNITGGSVTGVITNAEGAIMNLNDTTVGYIYTEGAINADPVIHEDRLVIASAGSYIGEGDVFNNLNNPTQNGGAINNAGILALTKEDDLNKPTFNGNRGAIGGAIYNTGTVNALSDAIFTGNIASSQGGALYNNGTVVSISGANFTTNSATSGGAINNNTSHSINSISGTTFSGNTSSSGGGAIYNSGSIGEILESSFSGNSAGTYGGAIYNSKTITSAGSSENKLTFANNTAVSGGGAIYNNGGTISNTLYADFTENSLNQTGITAYSYAAGGAINNEKSTINAIVGNFTDNSVTSSGSGVSVYNNSQGGAIANYVNAASGISSIGSINGTFDGNSVTGINGAYGGAISNMAYKTGTSSNDVKALITSISGSFINNTATATASEGVSYGGAISNYKSDSNVASAVIDSINATFTNNTADVGGAIYNNSAVINNISDSTFSGNSAELNGGAIYNTGTIGITANSGNVSFTNNYVGTVVRDGDGNITDATDATLNDIYNAGTLSLNAADTRTITLNGGITGSNGTLNVNTAASQTGTVTAKAIAGQSTITLGGGTLNITDAATTTTFNVTNDAILNAVAGLTVDTLAIEDNKTLTNSGKITTTGDLTIAEGRVYTGAGTLNVAGHATFEDETYTSTGTLNLTGGTRTISGEVENLEAVNLIGDVSSGTTKVTGAVVSAGVTSGVVDAREATIGALQMTDNSYLIATTGNISGAITNDGTIEFFNTTDGNIGAVGTVGGGDIILVDVDDDASTGVVYTTTGVLADQDILVEQGNTLHIAGSTHLGANSTAYVEGGATLNAIDGAINDYMTGDLVTLASGANVQVDITSAEIDKFASEAGTINLTNAAFVGTGDLTGTFQIASNGTKVSTGEGALFVQTGDKTIALVGTGESDGKVKVHTTSSTGLNGAVEVSDTGDITYTMTGNETVNANSEPAIGHIQDKFTVNGGGKTITATAGTYGFIVDGKSTPTADDGKTLVLNNVTLQGFSTGTVTSGTIYDGIYEATVTNQNGATLDINNSTLYGAGDAKLAVANYGTFTSDPTTYHGGVANYLGATATIDGDTFTGIDRTGYNGGAIDNEAGGTLTLNNVTFTGNTANNGGALYNLGTATISGGSFTNNTAVTNGGAIYNALGATLSVTDATFSGNTATLGGDIYNAGTATILASAGNMTVNDIYNTGTLNLNSATGKTLTIGGAAGTGSTIINSGSQTGTVSFTGDVNTGALTVTAGTLANEAGLTVTSGANNGVITMAGTAGTFTLNDGGAGLVFDNNGSFTQKTLTITGGEFQTNANNLHLTDAIVNDDTLTIEGGTLNNIVNNGTGTGHTDINTATKVTFNAKVNQAINVIAGELETGAANIGGVVDNAAQLTITGGTLTQNVNDASASGTTDLEGTAIVNTGVTVTQTAVNVAGTGAGVENKGSIISDLVNKVASIFKNTGSITGSVTNNSAGTTTVAGLTNTGTITGGLTNSGTVDNTNGTITGDIVNSSGTIITDIDNIATAGASTIKNDGTLKLTGGTISKDIAKVTSGAGIIDIAGNVDISGSTVSVTDNKIQLSTSGTFDVTSLANAAGAINLSAVGSAIVGNGGTLDVQDDLTGLITLGNLDLSTGNINLAIDVDLDGGSTAGTADHLTVGGTLTTGTGVINISNIALESDSGHLTPDDILIADNTIAAGLITLSHTTVTGDNIDDILLSLTTDATGTYLHTEHATLTDAITSEIKTKAFSVAADSSFINATAPVAMGGTSLSITGNNHTITGTVAGNDGISLASGKTLTITGATLDNFGTVLIGAAGSTINLTDVTFTNNTKDVSNAGTLNLSGTNTLSSYIDNDATMTNSGTLNGGYIDNTGNITNYGGATIASIIANNTNGVINNYGNVTGVINNIAGKLNNYATGTNTISSQVINSSSVENYGNISGLITNNSTGSLTNTAVGTITGGITNSGAVVNAGAVNTGAVNNLAGTFTNLGTVSSQFINSAALENYNSISGLVTNNSTGSFTNTAAGTVTGGITNSGAVVNAGAVNTGAVNNLAGTFTNLGTVSSQFINSAKLDNYNSISGLVTNTSTGTLNNTSAGTISGGVTNEGTVSNRGVINTGAVNNLAGTFTNESSGSVASAVVNSAVFNNEGAVSGFVTNATNGTLVNKGSGSMTGGVTNAGAFDNHGNVSTGAINNVTGGTLRNFATGTNTISSQVINSATAENYGNISGLVTNNSTGSFTNTAAGTVTGGITNSGAVVNAGAVNTGAVNNLAGTFTNLGTVASQVINSAKVDNYNSISGLVTNTSTGTLNNTSAGTISGGVTNEGLFANSGNVNTGAVTNNDDGVVNNTANGVIASAIINKAGGTVNNDGTLTGLVTNFGESAPGADDAGVVNTIASGLQGGATNEGTLNLYGDTTAGTNVLASDITGTGETFILGTVNTTAGRAIIQATVETKSTGVFTNLGDITATDIKNSGTTNINGGTVNATNITNTTGTTNINGGAVTATNVTNTAGTTNINTAITATNVNANGGDTNINAGANASTSSMISAGATVNIGAGNANVNTTAASFDIDNVVAGASSATSNLTLATGNAVTPQTAAGYGTDFTISSNISNATLELTSGQLTLPNETNLTSVALAIDNAATLNTMDGTVLPYNSAISFANGAQLKMDVDVLAQKSDSFTNIVAEGANTYLTDVTIENLDKIVYNNTDINLNGTTGLTNLKPTAELQGRTFQAMTPIRIMEATIDGTGMMNIHPSSGRNDWRSYNPAVLVSPIAAQLGGYLTQLNSYDEAFRNMDMYMLMTNEQRQAMKFRNKIASNGGLFQFDPNYNHMEQAGGWFRPYATFEKVSLKNGPRVENEAYGSFFGGDSGLHELGNGWDGMYSVYVGYNGSHQHYNGQSIYQNGGTLGLAGMAYKGNFFIGGTVNAGGNAGEASTTYGHDNFAMMMAGAATKFGYNWELLKGKFIIQPSYQMSYSFVNTFDYTNSAGVKINTKPLNAIQIEPGLKFIGNLKNGWQPYAGISMVWNIMDKTNYYANDIALPEMSVKPYVKYGIGVRKAWGERLTGFGQTYITNGGRNGVGIQFGFRWALGKKPFEKSGKASAPEMKKAEINLSSLK